MEMCLIIKLKGLKNIYQKEVTFDSDIIKPIPELSLIAIGKKVVENFVESLIEKGVKLLPEEEANNG